MSCPFAEGWKNKEGWLMIDAPEPYNLVCMDWDDYCTKCHKDDTKDFIFGLREEYLDKEGEVKAKAL